MSDADHTSNPNLTPDLGGDTSTELADIVLQFLAELPGRVAHLERLWSERRLEELERSAHQLKGSGGCYGFRPISDAAARLEADLRALGSIDDSEDASRLQGELDALLDACRRAGVGA